MQTLRDQNFELLRPEHSLKMHVFMVIHANWVFIDRALTVQPVELLMINSGNCRGTVTNQGLGSRVLRTM